MSVVYNSKQILNDCVVHIDASNSKCYPGAGQIAYDLSGNGKNGTVAGPIFSTGKFTFDGVNDVISFGVGNDIFPLPQISYEFVFRSTGTVPTTGTNPALCGLTYGIRLLVGQAILTAYLDDGVGSPSLSTSGSGNFFNGQWNHVVVTHDGANFKIYLNGVLSNSTTSTWLGVTRWPTNSAYIGRDNNNTMYFFSGDISVFRLYKNALSADQIFANFNQIRGRYGL